MKKIIIAGPRDFNDYEFFCRQIDPIVSGQEIMIIEGGALGIDSFARKYAKERNIKFHTEQADWKRFGRAAGPKRNEIMAKMANTLIAFKLMPNGTKGTNSMIKIAGQNNLEIILIPFQLGSDGKCVLPS